MAAESTYRSQPSQSGRVSQPPDAETVVRDFMATFTEAWPTGDAEAVGRFFSEDAEYRNGPSAPVSGRDAIIGNLASMMAMGGEVSAHIIHMVSDGPVVMIERIDYVNLGGRTAGLRIAGVFEVHNARITAWRDYFDATEFGSQLSPTDPDRKEE
jgi:limonene-1,2-epoxide hydrolase